MAADQQTVGWDSVAATGAKPGDKVKCVGLAGDTEGRFRIGREYHVVDFCGSPMVGGQRGGTKAERNAPPSRGYGFLWEKVT